VIYLDFNATTPLRPEVRAAMLPFFGDEFGNPSSVHRLGSRARVAVENARTAVAALIAARPSEIVFTSGGTESNNLALLGVAAATDGAIVTTPIEHSSVLEPIAALARAGREVVQVRVDGFGRIELGDLAERLRRRVALVTVGWANNEIGTIQPIAEVSAVCRAAGVPLHVDAVQAAAKISVAAPDCDLMSLSAHKLGGPKGVGALFVRSGTPLVGRALGGGQERGLRAGTENVAGIVGFGVACAVAEREPEGREVLRESLWQGLAARIAGLERNSPRDHCLPNTLNLRVAGIRGEALVAALDLEDIAVSTGSACAAGAAEPSHVLRAIGSTEADARDGVRFSLGPDTTRAEIDHVVRVMDEIVSRMRGVVRKAAYA